MSLECELLQPRKIKIAHRTGMRRQAGGGFKTAVMSGMENWPEYTEGLHFAPVIGSRLGSTSQPFELLLDRPLIFGQQKIHHPREEYHPFALYKISALSRFELGDIPQLFAY